MVGHPCNRAASTLRAHICQVLLTQGNGPGCPSLPPRCLPTAKRWWRKQKTQLQKWPTHMCISVSSSQTTLCRSSQLWGWGGWPQSLSITPPLSVNPLLKDHSHKKCPKSLHVHEVLGEWSLLTNSTENILAVSCPVDPKLSLKLYKPSVWDWKSQEILLLDCLATKALGRFFFKEKEGQDCLILCLFLFLLRYAFPLPLPRPSPISAPTWSMCSTFYNEPTGLGLVTHYTVNVSSTSDPLSMASHARAAIGDISSNNSTQNHKKNRHSNRYLKNH